jgi:hypothetical protein
VADALARDAGQHGQRIIDQLDRARFDPKAQALLKARGADDPGRVFDKAQAVERPDQALFRSCSPP